jgi:hypothetical protein
MVHPRIFFVGRLRNQHKYEDADKRDKGGGVQIYGELSQHVQSV